MNKDPYNSITQCLSYILESKFELQIYVFFFSINLKHEILTLFFCHEIDSQTQYFALN